MKIWFHKSLSCSPNAWGFRSATRAATFLLALPFLFHGLLSRAGAQSHAIFDGQSLEGWEGDTHYWSVENGTILGNIPAGESLGKNTWLVWRAGTLKDFELNLQFRLTGLPAANSGIQIRCQVDSVDHVSGYQADLDMGSTWLGRIYDEHGRALLVERGARVHIAPDGQRRTQLFAPLHQFPVLYRENQWNDYRIVAIGERIDVFVNGTLFSSLWDQQTNERDLEGSLALQLHSGPETHISFRALRLENLSDQDIDRLSPFRIDEEPQNRELAEEGIIPKGSDGKPLNLGFELGTLEGWHATGDAFRGQPLSQDGIAQRWPGQSSNKSGDFFIGGYELAQDAGIGTLESEPFIVSHPYGGFLLGGGEATTTGVEVLRYREERGAPEVIAHVVGNNQEQMRRVAIDLREHQGATIAIRLVDENAGGWGHLNFDDFRFYDHPPAVLVADTSKRTTFNAILQHLVPNPSSNVEPDAPGANTVSQMYVPSGFSVDVIAAEPDVHQPIAAAFDPKGRLWVIEAFSYPQKRADGDGLDRVVIFSDADGDGQFESKQIFAEGLNLASGIEIGYGGVWIGAAPQLLFLPDRDGDDLVDGPAEILLDGFGYGDTHETLNSFVWGPDGWLYGTQGVFNTSLIGAPGSDAQSRQHLAAGVWRYHPTRKTFEVFAHGGSNPWGLDFDAHGQWFMTHCRSFWGRGGTTHVLEGGHYWNQVNSGYPPFISSVGLPSHPHLQNFLLASARYDSGEGGAGKPGTGDIYGGHSHVGTLIYLGDNWPDKYRNHLLTHNLHGHQINHQINRREAGGYNTLHAGQDVLFCSDPQFIGVDLLLGPDGAVYMTDWYDPRLCHNPAVEAWDRGNGRIYRMKYDATFRPAHVDWTLATDGELLSAQRHRNDWHARAARLVLGSRYSDRPLPDAIRRDLEKTAREDADKTLRLRALWTLQTTQATSWPLLQALLNDSSEYVRSEAIRASIEGSSYLDKDPSFRQSQRQWFIDIAKRDWSSFVRRTIAASVGKLPAPMAWEIGAVLAKQPDNQNDRDLPFLIWQGLAKHWPSDPTPALELAIESPLPVVRDSVSWYAAATSETGRDFLIQKLQNESVQEQRLSLELLEHALRGQRNVALPAQWNRVGETLYRSEDSTVRQHAEWIGAFFGDESLLDRQRELLQRETPIAAKLHAIELLGFHVSPKNLTPLLSSLNTPELTIKGLGQLRRYDTPEIASTVLQHITSWNGEALPAAMDLLTSRKEWAKQLLQSIEDKRLDKSILTAFHARQIALLGDPSLQKQLTEQWGRVGTGTEALRAEIQKTVLAYQGAPLWAFDTSAGQAHFQRLCASCHSLEREAANIAPSLRGTAAKGIAYAIENVIDPNAVIGRDYQARIVRMDDGQVVTGLVLSESASAIELRTATDTMTIDRKEIDEIRVSDSSFMPQGLLESLDERQRIELFKFLLSL